MVRLSLVAYCLGILSGTVMGDPDEVLRLLLPTLACEILIWLYLRRQGIPIPPWLIVSSAVLIGLGWHAGWAGYRLQNQLATDLEGIDTGVIGRIVSLPKSNGIARQFEFRTEVAVPGLVNRTLLLNDYGDSHLQPGQRWRFTVRLNRPNGFANPGGFDYEGWLFQRAIAAKGYIRPAADNELLGSSTPGIASLRYRLRQSLQRLSTGLQNQDIVLALTLGDRSEIRPQRWRFFSQTGTNHLFVISGLHIGMIAMACYWLTSFCHSLLPTVAQLVPRQQWAATVAIVAALGYSLLAGFNLPAQRAFIMIAVFMLGKLARRPSPVAFRFWLAMAIVLSLNPLAGINPGFWLSFLAVGALLLCHQFSTTRVHTADSQPIYKKLVDNYVRPQWIVFIALLVPLAAWTQTLSLLAPVVNILAIPVVGFAVVPLCLLSLVLSVVSDELARSVLVTVDWLLSQLFQGMQELLSATDRLALLEISKPGTAALLLAGLATLLLLLPLVQRRRLLAIPLLLPFFFPQKNLPALSELAMHVLDVGQGLAVIIQTRDHALLYDTGAGVDEDSNLGRSVIVPALRQLGIKRLSTVVISHADNDHAGGLPGVISQLAVDRLYSSDPAVTGRLTPIACRQGLGWSWNGIEFRFLHPDVLRESSNNNSCVLQIIAGMNRVLLPGDIEKSTERRLALAYRDSLRSNIVIAPHHGSNSSSSYPFIKMTQPQFVVFAAGYRNSFGHPAPKIVARYLEFHADTFSSYSSGMLSFRIQSNTPIEQPSSYRQQNPRYWRRSGY